MKNQTTILEKVCSTKLTKKERVLLLSVLAMYTPDDNLCFSMTRHKCTPSDKGVLSSLVKKGLIYDSHADMREYGYEPNYFPAGSIIDALDAMN